LVVLHGSNGQSTTGLSAEGPGSLGRPAVSYMVMVQRPNEENWGFLITQRTHVINFHYYDRLHM
jgi:hypothetical protein